MRRHLLHRSRGTNTPLDIRPMPMIRETGWRGDAWEAVSARLASSIALFNPGEDPCRGQAHVGRPGDLSS
jgi:hypothetical protein